VRNNRLADAVHRQAFSALSGSPGARAYYDAPRDRDISYNAALRQLGNRLVGILHGCLKTHTRYDEATAGAAEATLAAAVTRARQGAATWSVIGAQLGVSRQGAQQRFTSCTAASKRPPLRRGHCLEPAHPTGSGLTPKTMGCLAPRLTPSLSH